MARRHRGNRRICTNPVTKRFQHLLLDILRAVTRQQKLCQRRGRINCKFHIHSLSTLPFRISLQSNEIINFNIMISKHSRVLLQLLRMFLLFSRQPIQNIVQLLVLQGKHVPNPCLISHLTLFLLLLLYRNTSTCTFIHHNTIIRSSIHFIISSHSVSSNSFHTRYY